MFHIKDHPSESVLSPFSEIPPKSFPAVFAFKMSDFQHQQLITLDYWLGKLRHNAFDASTINITSSNNCTTEREVSGRPDIISIFIVYWQGFMILIQK